MKVLGMLLTMLTLFSTSAQAMRYGPEDRESSNVEDRRHPIFGLPADKLVQVCEQGYHTSYLIFKNAYGSVEKSKEIAVQATLVSLKVTVGTIQRIPTAIMPGHPQFPAKCAVAARSLTDVVKLCECTATEVQAACAEIVGALNDGGFAACVQQK